MKLTRLYIGLSVITLLIYIGQHLNNKGVTTILILMGDILPYLIFSCALVLLFNFQKLEKHYLVASTYLIIALSACILMIYMAEYLKNNLMLIPLYGFFELSLFTYLYTKYMGLERHRNLIFTIALPTLAFILFEVFTIDFNDIENFQSYSRTIDSFVIIILCMIFFFENLTKDNRQKDSKIHLNTILLIFFAINFIYFLPLNFLIGKNSYLIKFYFWVYYNILISLFYIYFTYALWINGRTRKR